jgi:hypothetical protein
MNDMVGNPEGSAEAGFVRRPLWVLVLFALTAVQTVATLGLFGPDRSWRNLCDERPILNGRHPLHLYHGLLGAQSWRDGGFGSCYDPAFQAGYPKTPIFDSGSRPAELLLLIGEDRIASYKIGLAVWCALVPLIFATAVRLLQLHPATACLAACFGLATWWTTPVQRLLGQGELDWLLAGLILILHVALVVRFHQDGGPLVWLGLFLTAAAGWFLHPILWLGFGLLFVPFYLGVARKHHWVWNLSLWSAWGGGLLVNCRWLGDWVGHCWIQRPLSIGPTEQVASSLARWWFLDLGIEQEERSLAALLLCGGLVGVVALLARRRVAAAFALGATALLLPALSAGSGFWEPLESIGASKLFVLALAFAALPCAIAMTDLCALLGRITCRRRLGGAIGAALLANLLVWHSADVEALARQVVFPKPFQLGLNDEQQALVKVIRVSTRPDARILWEERPNHPFPTWTALLPEQTQRAYLGGLDPEAVVDHLHLRLTRTQLCGCPLAEMQDRELKEFCDRYNVGHIVCWSPETVARFRAWAPVDLVETLHEGGPGWLLAVKRPPTFVIKGKARLVQADAGRIALADVEPDDGELVLSLHYQDGFQITPGPARAERVMDAHDPVPLLRLKLPGPVLRLTLSWGKP